MREKKSVKVFLLFILLGIVIGGGLGEFIGKMPISLPRNAFLNTVNPFEMSIGMNETIRNQDGTVKEVREIEPMYVDLGVVAFKFGFAWRFNFISIIGIALAFLIYKNIRI